MLCLKTISYEIRLAFILLYFVALVCRYDLVIFIFFSGLFVIIFFFFSSFIVRSTSCLAQTNRIPFDFAESESELVSGFNVECGYGGFAFVFSKTAVHTVTVRYGIGCLQGNRLQQSAYTVGM